MRHPIYIYINDKFIASQFASFLVLSDLHTVFYYNQRTIPLISHIINGSSVQDISNLNLYGFPSLIPATYCYARDDLDNNVDDDNIKVLEIHGKEGDNTEIIASVQGGGGDLIA